ncbi:RNA polymerase sigma-70 factor [Niastella koreensis]|uniref:RNA polymerase sigma-70 factor n=1 Tax=Niastella koreensis TaxID=354356 RepID=UPI0013FD76D6|nr:RNA polymerase sigma-70 factor [Niastella koreensis]
MLPNLKKISNSSNHTASLLWTAIRQGDEKAFELLYNNTVLPLTNQAYNILKDKELVKDILQDVFVSLYTRRNELPTDLNIVGYLTNAVKYKVSTHLRDQLSRHTHHVNMLNQEQQTAFTQPFPYEQRELKNRIRESIDTLPEKCRQAFMLNHYGSMSYKDIAQEMGISVKTVEKHIGKALQVLRRELNEEKLIPVALILLSTLPQNL